MTSSTGEQSETTTEPYPVDTFKLVGNEVRMEILRALGEASVQDRHYREIPFTELNARLDGDIDTSRLNYHLKHLVGHFVKKGDDGYKLGPEGIYLYRAIRSGRFDKREERQSAPAGFDCHYCESSVDARFDQGVVEIGCSECGFTYHRGTTTADLPGAFDDPSEAVAHYGRYFQHRVLGWAAGICQICGNMMDEELIFPETKTSCSGTSTDIREKVSVSQSCANCGAWQYGAVGTSVLADPEVMSFCYDHGVDLVRTPYWELEFAATTETLTVRSTDPWEVALDVSFDGDTLRLVLDETVTVTDRTRL